MIFKSLSLPEMEQVRLWRNDIMASLRTPFLLTQEMQEDFYVNVVCNRIANSRYWGIWVEPSEDVAEETFIGLCGIENIQWENRLGEIALIINPDSYGMGYGTEAVRMLLDQGFNYFNLENVFGECYLCSPVVEFWIWLCEQWGGYKTMLPNRKFYGGKYHDALYFNFARNEYKGG
jgi:RimJ/RimL family protein N-acetyltransferase